MNYSHLNGNRQDEYLFDSGKAKTKVKANAFSSAPPCATINYFTRY